MGQVQMSGQRSGWRTYAIALAAIGLLAGSGYAQVIDPVNVSGPKQTPPAAAVPASQPATPTGRISVLEDTDGDGRMDRSTVFLDHLVLPRAVSFVRGGALVAIPPNLYFCQDTNGDLVCDTKTLVATDYGLTGNPEHQPNGLLPGIDNWIYSANYDKRLRFLNGTWLSEPHQELGQWGITQDNTGRLFHDSNTDQLRGSLIPPHYADRHPH